MKLYMIRHGYTKGNEEKRYVGVTDESLSEQGRENLQQLAFQLKNVDADVFYTSPMKRCKETLEILFPNQVYEAIDSFRECDFGKFEYKNYQELDGNTDYQSWIDSGGTEPFPDGESPQGFRERCQKAFGKLVEEVKRKEDVEAVVMVVHGGTIMAILDGFSSPHREYFSWQIENGNGYVCVLSEESCVLESIEKLVE